MNMCIVRFMQLGDRLNLHYDTTIKQGTEYN